MCNNTLNYLFETKKDKLCALYACLDVLHVLSIQ